MTINSPAAILLAFYVCVGEEQGVPRDQLRGHGADGHPQGVHRAEGVHLPAGRVDAARDRHGRVVHARAAADAPDLDLRLPHPRGRLDRRAGARVHARERVHVRRVGDRARASTSTSSRRGSRSSSTRTSTSSRRSRSTAPPGGSGRASCATASARRSPRSLLMRFHTQTAGRVAHRAAARGEHRPHGDRGARGGARRHAVAAHELVRRGARAADRGRGAARAADAAGDRARDRRRRTRSTRSAARTTSST